jgi:hypothetical protein
MRRIGGLARRFLVKEKEMAGILGMGNAAALQGAAQSHAQTKINTALSAAATQDAADATKTANEQTLATATLSNSKTQTEIVGKFIKGIGEAAKGLAG